MIMRWLVILHLLFHTEISKADLYSTPVLHLPLTVTREIPCGFETSSGVDDNDNGVLELDERIVLVIVCDKDRDYDPNNPMAKTIIRTQGR